MHGDAVLRLRARTCVRGPGVVPADLLDRGPATLPRRWGATRARLHDQTTVGDRDAGPGTGRPGVDLVVVCRRLRLPARPRPTRVLPPARRALRDGRPV